MSNKGGRVSPDYLADIAPEYASQKGEVRKSAFESGHYIRRGTVGKEFALHEIHRGSDVVEEAVIALAQIVQACLPV